jgi:Ras-related C3 botulinum toxin substrate 1
VRQKQLTSSYNANVIWNNQNVSFDLRDTAGQEDFDRLRPLSYPDTNVFLVCFSVVNPSSYSNVKTKWVPELKHHAPEVPIILVGTKLDLRDDEEMLKKLREKDTSPVTEEMGNKLKSEIGAVAYGECSAKTQKGLKEIFILAIESVLSPKGNEKPKKGDCCLS